QRGKVEKISAQPAAIGRGGQESDVPRERAQVSSVIREPLELQPNRPQSLSAGRGARTGKRLQIVAIRRRMADCCVAGERFRIVNGAFIRTTRERAFDTSVLVPQ